MTIFPEPSLREDGAFYRYHLPSLNRYAAESRIAALFGRPHKATEMNPMAIGMRLRELREQKGLSQEDLERLTGIKRCYTSRVEHGHTVPGLGNLERYAAGIGVPVYRLFYEGDEPPPLPKVTPQDLQELAREEGKKRAETKLFLKLMKPLAKVGEPDRGFFLALAQRLAAAKK